MKAKRILWLPVAAFLFTTCETTINTPDNPEGGQTSAIPSDFDWKTCADINCEVEVSPGENAGYVHTIRIYSSPLLKENTLLASGAAKPGSPFRFNLAVPAFVSTLYVEDIEPGGIRTIREIAATEGSIKLSPASTLRMRKTAAVPAIDLIPEPAQYDVIVSANDKNITLSAYQNGENQKNEIKSYLIPADVTCTGIKFATSNGQARLFVKGMLNISKGNINPGKCTLIVLEGGKIIFPDMQSADADIQIYEGGTFRVRKLNYSGSRPIINKGILHIEKEADLNNSAVCYNFGSWTGGEDENEMEVKLSNQVRCYNYGKINGENLELNSTVSLLNGEGGIIDIEDLTLTNRTTLTNNGKIYVDDDLEITSDATLENYCLLKADEIKMSGSTIELYEGAFLEADEWKGDNTTIRMEGGSHIKVKELKDVYNLKFINQTPDFALFTCKEKIEDLRWAQVKFQGNIELLHLGLRKGSGENGDQLYPASLFSGGAYITGEQKQGIRKTACNQGEGSMAGTITDSDGDGVPDEEDRFPNDPERAFISYFPNSDTWGTYTFEDLWPATGDYDMNDLVLGFQIAWISNSSNQIVEMQFRSKIRAVGSAFSLAAAFQLDRLAPSQIASVTGNRLTSGLFAVASNGTETGQAKAVVPLFDSDKEVWKWIQRGNMGNTLPDGGRIEGDSLTVKVIFATPVAQETVGMNDFNLFITANGRENEIHLAGYAKTDKGQIPTDIARDGLKDDDLYKNRDNMIWGLMIPETFDYPLEKVHLKNAYLHFEEWAQSGGTQYRDWYQNKSGYRNDENIYR